MKIDEYDMQKNKSRQSGTVSLQDMAYVSHTRSIWYSIKKCICLNLLDATVMYTYTVCIGTVYKIKAITLVLL